MYIFISHSSKDFKTAQSLCEFLETNGHKCFLAPRDIRSGHIYAEELVDGIDNSDAVILLLSKASDNSPHVLREIERAVSKKKTIIVDRLEEFELSKAMEYFLMTHQWINANQGKEFDEILNCINQRMQKRKSETEVKPVEKTKQDKKIRIKLLWGILSVFALLSLIIAGGIYFRIHSGSKRHDSEYEQKGSGIGISLGDTITFGNYNGEPIEWRVLKLSEDGQRATILSKYILTMKAYDAAESGKYNFYEGKDYWGVSIAGESEDLQHLLRGNSKWSISNIRTWLNATQENIKYENGEPKVSAMSALQNGYDMEPGFLSYFTKEEQEAICLTQIETNGETTEDKVFLLSSEELPWFENANISLLAIPTKSALKQDKTDWYEIYALDLGVEDYFWWLRDTDGESNFQAYVVCNSYSKEKMKLESVGLEGFGIRPAMTIDLSKECIRIK